MWFLIDYMNILIRVTADFMQPSFPFGVVRNLFATFESEKFYFVPQN